ncbi:Ig-like domain-containing protein [Caproiciproducens sp. LBM24188]
MYDTVNSAFSDALKREGKVITAYSDNTPYNVIFRRNSDTNKLQNTITIFYNADSTIYAGQLLKYKDKTYLSINQESAENDTYLKSDLRQTNAVMNYISGGMEFNVPVYAYDVNDALIVESSAISVVGGNIEILAEDNSITRALKINDCFYALGGYWKIDNLIYKDNVIYIYVERETTSTTYTVTITANDSYDRGTTAQFTATAKAGDTVVTNANIIWSSSDTSKATVDSSGNVTFLANGSVDISAAWQEHSVSSTKSITITEPPVYGLTIAGNDSYTTSDTPTLTATATINGTADTTATITWISSDTSIATIDSTGKITFLKAGSVIFTATWVEHNKTATKAITVTVPVPTTQYTCKITNTTATWTEYNDTTNIATVKVGGSLKPFMCHFYDSTGTEVTNITPVWSINVSGLTTAQQAEIHLTYQTAYPLRAYLNVDNDTTLIGLQFTLSLTNSTGTCEVKTVPIKITSLM